MQLKPITEIAARLDVTPDQLIPFGHHKAKLPLSLLDRPAKGRLILVSALTPTPAGEGKTTTSIGLGQALDHLGKSVCLALREPSLGPCFGIKGGGTGGGQSKLEPSVDINLHFNGDFHAITAAHNLLASVVDNALHFGSDHGIDPRRLMWKRVMDQNDRSLRRVMVGLGGAKEGVPRETGFDITAASEVMAILCLARDQADLRERLENILVGFRPGRGPLYARELEVAGAMLALLKDALLPNLVQTTEGTPALVHGGPFANIAHGCNSVIATRMALRLADYVVTEAGFGMDLGGQKFLDIKCAGAGLKPSMAVLVATVKALKMHGRIPLKRLRSENVDAVITGFSNLEVHLETLKAYGLPAVVAINRHPGDTDAEIRAVVEGCAARGIRCATAEHFQRGGQGAVDLAQAVLDTMPDSPPELQYAYDWGQSIEQKLAATAKRAYGARGVVLTAQAKGDAKRIRAIGHGGLPICMAKTQYSLSDNPKKVGRPNPFDIKVRALRENTGAGFIVALTGDILRMPGLPKRPAAADVDVVDGEIVGIG